MLMPLALEPLPLLSPWIVAMVGIIIRVARGNMVLVKVARKIKV